MPFDFLHGGQRTLLVGGRHRILHVVAFPPTNGSQCRLTFATSHVGPCPSPLPAPWWFRYSAMRGTCRRAHVFIEVKQVKDIAMHWDPTPSAARGANWPSSLHGWVLALKPHAPATRHCHMCTLPSSEAIGFGRGEAIVFGRGGGDAVWERRE